MDKEELYDLIERYLDDALPDAERLEVERRIAADASFRAEVELHRAMQQHLSDPDELHLRAMLDNVRGGTIDHATRPQTKTGTGFSIWRRYWAAAAAILILLAALFWWLQPSPPVIEQPVVETPSLPAPVPDKEPEQGEQQQQAPPQPDKQRPRQQWQTPPQPDKQQPIAMADPADYAMNDDLEKEITAYQLRSPEAEVTFLSPDSAAVLKRRSDNTIDLRFHIRVSPELVSDDQPFKMFIYSNKPQDWEKKKPVFSRDLTMLAVGDTAYEARFRQKLSLAPGLYYVVVGQQRRNVLEGEDPYRTRRVGKFSVVE